MDKDMASAYNPKLKGRVGRLNGTGIKLRVTEKDTGKEVHYGVQLNNTTLEIEALPNLKVEVVGYSDMYEALREAETLLWKEGVPKISLVIAYDSPIIKKLRKVLAKAEGK